MDLDGLYRDIVETSPDGIWVLDLEGRTLYANPAIARMYGCDESELPDLTVFDTLDETGREQFAEHLRDLRRGSSTPRTSRSSSCGGTGRPAGCSCGRARCAPRTAA